MRFVCDTSPDGSMFVSSACNPVTHTEVHIVPPYRWETWDQLDVLLANFEVYCRVNYHFGGLDPAGVDVSGWPSEAPDVSSFRAASPIPAAVPV
jgi:hypothetical protein